MGGDTLYVAQLKYQVSMEVVVSICLAFMTRRCICLYFSLEELEGDPPRLPDRILFWRTT